MPFDGPSHGHNQACCLNHVQVERFPPVLEMSIPLSRLSSTTTRLAREDVTVSAPVAPNSYFSTKGLSRLVSEAGGKTSAESRLNGDQSLFRPFQHNSIA